LPRAQPGQRFGGRGKGAVNKRTAAIRAVADKAIEEGVTPLEVMLNNMRFYVAEADKMLAKIIAGKEPTIELVEALKGLTSFRNRAEECAVDAAPYVHAKLATHTISGDPDNPLTIAHAIQIIVTEDGKNWTKVVADRRRAGLQPTIEASEV
jgi:hypothetical protein